MLVMSRSTEGERKPENERGVTIVGLVGVEGE